MANKNKNYYGFKNNKKTADPYGKYVPGLFGKFVMGFTVPSAVIALIAGLTAFIVPQLMIVAIATFIIAFVGSILLMVDIIIFNRRQKKGRTKDEGPKELDIMRIVHLLVGMVLGIAIGYLIWGIR